MAFLFKKTTARRCAALGLLAAVAMPALQASAKAPEKLFYMIGSVKSFNSFQNHIDKIDVVVPTWYNTDKDGLVSGNVDPRVLAIAHAHHVPVEPILALMNHDDFHKLLGNPKARHTMIESIVDQAVTNHLDGIQLDFEDVLWTDRDALSNFVREIGTGLHAHHLRFSVAICPNAPGRPGAGAFGRWMWQYWRGSYDLKAIGAATDYISLMTYDQHTRWTAPGPVGGWPWMVENIEYAERFVPKEKISLGIPLYGYHWWAGDPVHKDGTTGPNISADYIDADESLPLAAQYHADIQWDSREHEAFFWFERDQLREWIFLPLARSVRERYDYAKENGLLGTSAWVLGAEDPATWDALPATHGQ